MPVADPHVFHSPSEGLPERIRAAARLIGYAACGFTSCDVFTGYAEELRARVRQYPETEPVYAALARRADPTATAPWARSIVVAVRPYRKYRFPPEAIGHIGRNYLADRRNPECPDHAMPKAMTRALRELGLRTRRGGTPDRAAAARAGVVAIGRNGFAFSPEWGSWINIETWRVDAVLPPGDPLPGPCPAHCEACRKACPTGALVPPSRLRANRCIAYLTYGAPEPLDPELEARMEGWVYGCDACQDVCPLNHAARREEAPAPWMEKIAPRLTLQALAGMDLDTYLRVIQPRFWYLPPDAAGWRRWRRNAARALRAADGKTS